VTAYRIAMLVSGGMALVLAGEIGWRPTYLIMATFMAFEMLVTWFGPEPEYTQRPPATLSQR